MADVEIFDGIILDDTSILYDLYSRLEEGMYQATLETPPDFVSDIPFELNEDGSEKVDENGLKIVNKSVIAQELSAYSARLRKKSAYMLAKAFTTVGGGSGGEGTSQGGIVLRSGDDMTGPLSALYGFSAGHNRELIFDVTHNALDEPIAHIYGTLIIDEDVSVSGALYLDEQGIYFANCQSIYYGDNSLHIDNQNIAINGAIVVDGSIQLGDIVINENGLFYDDKEFYHSGNCNNPETDWSMKDGHVYGNLTVEGTQLLKGRLTALYGFDLGETGKKILYSTVDAETAEISLQLASDLNLLSGYGIKFDGVYIIKVRAGADDVVSFAAPGKTMNLGDSIDGLSTKQINLQTGIYQFNGDYEIISRKGDGQFRNSLLAGCGNSGPLVLKTYWTNENDCGVIFPKRIWFLDSNGPYFQSTDMEHLTLSIPKLHVSETNTPLTANYNIKIRFKDTDSLFHNEMSDSVTADFDTDGEFFCFSKRVESSGFLINSTKYKTCLIENALFFHDGIFIEGLPSKNGMVFTGDAYFNDNVGSMRFASGFAGYGWGIVRNQNTGNIAATFDELTIRKKMRVYELEVQKQSVTNGSLWVADSCSGDEVTLVV